MGSVGSSTFLIVDDDPDMLSLVQHILDTSFEECVCDTACNGEQAIQALADRTYDFLLTDLAMPRINGWQLLEAIRGQHSRMVRCVITAMQVEGSARLREHEFGSSLFFIQKPFKIEELIDTVGDMLLARADCPVEASDTREPAAESAVPRDNHIPAHLQDHEGEGLYPFIMGGLLHDALNTIQVLQYRTTTIAHITETDSVNLKHVSERLNLGLEHLSKTLQIMQAISRSYYSKDCGEMAGESSESIVGSLSQDHPNVKYTASISNRIASLHFPEGMMHFMVRELLENATRACAGIADAEITLSADLPDDHTISIECTDSGPGFPNEVLERMRSGSVAAPRNLGAGGYGLYFINQIVRRLDGTILVSNAEDGGARVQILLPVSSPSHGNWAQTGTDSISSTGLSAVSTERFWCRMLKMARDAFMCHRPWGRHI